MDARLLAGGGASASLVTPTCADLSLCVERSLGARPTPCDAALRPRSNQQAFLAAQVLNLALG
jgi:hypothetical protein